MAKPGDFEVFKQIIDVMGGVEVDVEMAFIDEKYPIPGREDDECLPAGADKPDEAPRSEYSGSKTLVKAGLPGETLPSVARGYVGGAAKADGDDEEFKCRYETVSFEKGMQLMDGETALKFSRSRNAEGDEGTDFARSVRQQKVIDAIREKMLSRDILYSPKKLLAIKDVLSENVETDIDEAALAILARRGWQAKNNINSDIIPEEFLENPPITLRYDNQYVFIPKSDDPETPENEWDEVHGWVNGVLE